MEKLSIKRNRPQSTNHTKEFILNKVEEYFELSDLYRSRVKSREY